MPDRQYLSGALSDMTYRPHLLCLAAAVSFELLACSRSVPPVEKTAQATGPDFVVENRELGQPLRLIAYGDMRFTDPKETSATNPKVRRWLVDKIAEEKPDAVLLSGDVPWHGGQRSDYDEYLAETIPWRTAHLRIYPALGNHEFSEGAEGNCLENWWSTFPELRGRRWYSVQLGDSVYVLNLDSNSSLLPGSEQIQWIGNQLGHLPSSARFVFFNLHHPPVVDVQANGDASHNGRPNEHALAAFLAQAPEKSRVRFVVTAGHVHNYERFYQDGIVYLVSGGGGARPYTIVRQPGDLYQDAGFPNYHYVVFVESDDRLVATMFRVVDPNAASPVWEDKDHFEIPPTVQAKSGSTKAEATSAGR